MIYIDVTDFWNVIQKTTIPDGMLRLQNGLLRSCLSRQESIVPVRFDCNEKLHWWIIDYQNLSDLFNAIDGLKEGDDWQDACRRVMEAPSEFRMAMFKIGDVITSPGSTLNTPHFMESICREKATGVKFVPFLHDVLPVTKPEHFEFSHIARFANWLDWVNIYSDLVLTSSHHVAGEFKRLFPYERHDGPGVIPIGLPNQVQCLNKTNESMPSPGVPARGGGFVLCVGTVEPRKNLQTLIKAWSRLYKALGDACPDLLVVGKDGWRTEGVYALAENLGLTDKVFFCTDVSDQMLRSLYHQCKFTVYPSLDEGWGLPVSESLATGKVVITGDHPAILEASQGLAVVVDSESPAALYEAAKELLTNTVALEKLEKTIELKFKATDPDAYLDTYIHQIEVNLAAQHVKQRGRLTSFDVDRFYFSSTGARQIVNGNFSEAGSCIFSTAGFLPASDWRIDEQGCMSLLSTSGKVVLPEHPRPHEGNYLVQFLVNMPEGNFVLELSSNAEHKRFDRWVLEQVPAEIRVNFPHKGDGQQEISFRLVAYAGHTNPSNIVSIRWMRFISIR